MDAYKQLLPDGRFVVNLPKGTSLGQEERIFEMLTGADRDMFRMPKRGMVTINKQEISKGASGLFGQGNYNESESTPTKLVFDSKGKSTT